MDIPRIKTQAYLSESLSWIGDGSKIQQVSVICPKCGVPLVIEENTEDTKMWEELGKKKKVYTKKPYQYRCMIISCEYKWNPDGQLEMIEMA